MSDIANNETPEVSEKPVQENDNVKFPPFPDPTDNDFEDDIPEEERNYYKTKFKDLNAITSVKLHCSACDRHLGCSARNESRMRPHPLLRTLVCHTCHTFYNSGEFEKGDDGSELYCRWCGQGGQVYCCSDCPHVFCAKCIRRNLGNPKIKEIEELDDWKCFKCNNKCLWDLRAICWAVLRYCDLKNKMTYETQDLVLKEAYQKHCAQDHSECCKSKTKRKEIKKKEPESSPATRKSTTASVISKIPPTIQVKKFASINIEEPIIVKSEKKAQKRPASPKQKAILIKNPIAISSKVASPIPVPKKIRVSNSTVINPVRFNNDRKVQPTYNNMTRIRPKPPQMSIMFNGYNNVTTYSNDNINLSLESLTQGLDMSAVAAIAGSSNDDDVVCTPDFPLEPLCEVTEEIADDDVQCMTPGPAFAPKLPPPPLVARNNNTLPDLSADNIVQMTENDVTVNSTTGGLKFRVDPQTLSSNKMYRLPDGRIFAINANPNMPGGYSATIVALTDNTAGKVASKGTTFAAKLSAVSTQASTTPTPPPLKYVNRTLPSRGPNKRSTPKTAKVTRGTDTSRICDLNVPVEWYRYNLIDAIDALEYSLSRLHHLKKSATTMHLRTRSLNEMRNLHRSLERSLTTSMTRFKEIRDNLNKEFKQYITKKTSSSISDDDDVEILHEEDNDDPIFIDENSLESNTPDNQEVDLTAVGSSDLNDSGERSPDKNDLSKNESDLSNPDHSQFMKSNIKVSSHLLDNTENCVHEDEHSDNENISNNSDQKPNQRDPSISKNVLKENGDELEKTSNENLEQHCNDLINTIICKTENKSSSNIDNGEKMDEDHILIDNVIPSENDKKVQDSEMSEEMIENLLKDDKAGNDDTQNIQSFDISDEMQESIPSEKD